MKIGPCLLLLLAVSCTKQDLESNCSTLKEGITGNDVARVKLSISRFIAALPNKKHTNENLLAMTQKIEAGCSVIVDAVCFSCIYTLPAQSEISVSFSLSGTTVRKVIDISETDAKEMRFVNMHD
ncbi:hypothetical protein HRH25_13180 [Flavisolibacter sp. BT320]|nr:hypothetical protein [Flavisolibacter longurius]